MFKLFYWIEEIITKKWVLVSLDLDKRAKSNEGLKIRDSFVNKIFTDGSLAEIKQKKKNLNSERSFVGSKQWTFAV